MISKVYTQGRKEREDIGKSAHYLLVLFLSPQVRKSRLNPSFR